MKIKRTYYLLTFWAVFNLDCGTDHKAETSTGNKSALVSVDSLQHDTSKLKETFDKGDISVNDYLAGKLKPIRENFNRINSIKNWSSTDEEELWETTEGGQATYYYSNGQLEKIVTRNFGETFQQLTEYYLLNAQLSFVFGKSYKYNRPMYYDSAAMKENNDTEAFNFAKSEITEDRSYFANGILIHRITNQTNGSPFTDDHLPEEQKRIKTDFEKLIKQAKKK